MGAMSRRKGRVAENEFCRLLGDELGIDPCRKLGQARDGGNDVDVGKFAIEVKRHETLALPGWWRQAVAACGGRIPAVAFRQSRKGWRVLTCWNWYQSRPDRTYDNTILATLPAFAAMVRETL